MADWLAVDSFGSGLLDSFMDTNLQRTPSWENFGSGFTLQEPALSTDSHLLLPENGLRLHSGDLPVHMVAMDKVTSAEQAAGRASQTLLQQTIVTRLTSFGGCLLCLTGAASCFPCTSRTVAEENTDLLLRVLQFSTLGLGLAPC